MKCKDIQDKPILKFLQDNDCWCTYGEGHFMPTVQEVMPKGTPIKLQLAKMKQLIKRGLVDGCTCGCRGDFEISDKGKEHLKKHSSIRVELFYCNGVMNTGLNACEECGAKSGNACEQL